jgi:hypothetical protein
MKIDRRRFIQDTAAAGSIPALTYFMLPFSGALARASLLSDPLAEQLPGGGIGGNDLMFKIYGWQRDDLAAFDRPENTSAGAGSDASPDQPVWISVSQSWRATWR